ncbi:MAG TPA: hypothetical protein VFU55_10905 [Terracidiphilus sp.]|nr:hypothetical protein [Terracidiphilus sp.]
MARKHRNLTFNELLDILRAHNFTVAASTTVSNGTLASKNGAAAVLVPAQQPGAVAAYAVRPGAMVQNEVALLLDRGYQKFLKTSKFELPATAAQLQAIHAFEEELMLLSGQECLYNEALGTTSDLYYYDRLMGRDEAETKPVQPWELAAGH